jgi:hypothetical protein
LQQALAALLLYVRDKQQRQNLSASTLSPDAQVALPLRKLQDPRSIGYCIMFCDFYSQIGLVLVIVARGHLMAIRLKRFILLAAALCIAATSLGLHAQIDESPWPSRQPVYAGFGWQQLPGTASAVAVGANGALWALGTEAVAGGNPIYRFEGNTWNRVAGAAVRISVDRLGLPWTVDAASNLLRWDPGVTELDQARARAAGVHPLPNLRPAGFVPVAGAAARDVAVDVGVMPWVIGTVAAPGGFEVLQLRRQLIPTTEVPRFDWTKRPGGLVRIAGNVPHLWGINASNQVLRFGSKGWEVMTGSATEIAVGANGTVYVIGTDRIAYRWDGAAWVKHPSASLSSISVDGTGVPYAVTATGEIYRGAP